MPELPNAIGNGVERVKADRLVWREPLGAEYCALFTFTFLRLGDLFTFALD